MYLWLLTLIKITPLCVSCVIYDYLLKNDVFHSLSYSGWLKVLCDEIGHGVIAALCWLVVVNYDFQFYIQVLTCGFVAVVIDVDHILAVKSWQLKVGKLSCFSLDHFNYPESIRFICFFILR